MERGGGQQQKRGGRENVGGGDEKKKSQHVRRGKHQEHSEYCCSLVVSRPSNRLAYLRHG